MAADGHYDIAGTSKHGKPDGQGHLGDLSNFSLGTDGKVTLPILAPSLEIVDIIGRS